jgi:hypothetical protein
MLAVHAAVLFDSEAQLQSATLLSHISRWEVWDSKVVNYIGACSAFVKACTPQVTSHVTPQVTSAVFVLTLPPHCHFLQFRPCYLY